MARTLACRILLAAILAVFYILEALAVRNIAVDAVKAAYVIWPREGWAMGMGAALLWLLISFFCCCASIRLPVHGQRWHVSGHSEAKGWQGLQQRVPTHAHYDMALCQLLHFPWCIFHRLWQWNHKYCVDCVKLRWHLWYRHTRATDKGLHQACRASASSARQPCLQGQVLPQHRHGARECGAPNWEAAGRSGCGRTRLSGTPPPSDEQHM